MNWNISTRIRGLAAMGMAAAVVLLLLPASPPAWRQTLDDLTVWRNAQIHAQKGAAKHAVGLKYYYMTRLYGSNVDNVERAQLDAYNEVESRLGKGMDKASMANDWTTIGPNNWAGRVRSIVFDPTDKNIVYAGGASGGVFKSTNGGMDGSWTAIMDFTDSIVHEVNTLTFFIYFFSQAVRRAIAILHQF